MIVLDGGLATALEARGHDLRDELWSARVLMTEPAAIRRLHLDYLLAGADCITAASYQGSLAGFTKRGATEAEAAALLRLSVTLAAEARETFWTDPARGDARVGRLRPLVAAGVGPYGAYLADGSEYTGVYGIDDAGLREFHRERWAILAATDADLLACETIPAQREAAVLLDLLRGMPDRWAWLSFSCRDGRRLWDGTELAAAARLCDAVANVAAVGINCTAPEHIPSLIAEARRGTGKPILVYPNSGERYDAASGTWQQAPAPIDWGWEALRWRALGADGIGGCCRVGPAQIAAMRRRLV